MLNTEKERLAKVDAFPRCLGVQRLPDEPLSGVQDLSTLLSSLVFPSLSHPLGLWQGEAYLRRRVGLWDLQAASSLFCI